MTLGSTFASRISLNSGRACCHFSPFAHALIPGLYLMSFGSNLTSRIPLSSDRARCHCSSFAQ
eukprot:3490121-Pyramimonas_sp.AAC.1